MVKTGGWQSISRVVALAAMAIATVSCGSLVRAGRAPSYIIMESLEASSGANSSTFEHTLESDVRTNGGVLEDKGQATMRLALKDVGTLDAPTQPTTNNIITLSRYHVEYRRSDGRNSPGVDVPYGFDGAVTASVTGQQAAVVTFVLVRVQAKLERPLANLTQLGGAIVISTIADVTFYGHDQTGNDVTVTGSISVNFADWADPQSGS